MEERLKKLANSRGYSLFCAICFGLLAAIKFQEYRFLLEVMEMGIGVTRSDARVQLGLAAMCALAAVLHLYQWWKKGRSKRKSGE